MSDVPASTQSFKVAVFETPVEMMKRAKIKRAYVLIFFPFGPATLAISGENFRALRAAGVPLITRDQARGVMRPKEV